MMFRAAFAFVIMVMVSPAWALSPELANELHRDINNWQVDRVRTKLTPFLNSDPSDPVVRLLQGRLLFFEGRYAEARVVLDSLAEEMGSAFTGELEFIRQEVVATHETLKQFSEQSSPDGRFLIRYMGRDELLVPYALDVLRRADEVYAKDFNYRPKGRIVVEIYPEIRYLAAVSPLSEEDIETSGTIALCKYNRLMITSPRALVRGYGWQDTLAHEFVHYYVNKRSENTVPIWLHEGIAKFQESRWRTQPGVVLEPPEEDLLARSVEADKLITFDQMHPSMAKLPSQEAAGLAFAEVHTVIGYLFEKHGYVGINKLLDALRDGAEMDAALRKAYGLDLDGLWSRWKTHIRAAKLKTYPGLVQRTLEFKRPGDSDDETPEPSYATIEEKQVKDFAHLGELLRARGRHRAAIVEYEKAMAIGGEGNPAIQNGAAASLLATGKPERVPTLLKRVALYYPGLVTTHLNIAEAYLATQRLELALPAFERARDINPFHPRPHHALSELYLKAGRAEDAKRETDALEYLK